MAKNSMSPVALANEVIELAKTRAQSSLKICQAFAQGWGAYQEGEWNNDQVATFLTRIYEAGIGSDPSKSILIPNADGSFQIPRDNSTYFNLKAVGEHSMFRDKDIVDACMVTGYSVLYALVRHYEACLGAKEDHDKAKKATLKLLALGSELDRRQIEDEIRKQKQKKAKSSAKEVSTESQETNHSTYQELLEQNATFDTIYLTPSDEVLDTIAGTTGMSLFEKYGYDDVRAVNANIHILANGTKLDAALKLASTMGASSPHVYGLARGKLSSRLVNLSQMEVLVTTMEIGLPSEKGDSGDLVIGAISDKNASQLHLFADTETEGWTTVLPKNSVG